MVVMKQWQPQTHHLKAMEAEEAPEVLTEEEEAGALDLIPHAGTAIHENTSKHSTAHAANGSANATANSNSESDGVFTIDKLSELETNSSVPDLLTLSESSYNDDYPCDSMSDDNSEDCFSEVRDDTAFLDDPDWTDVGSLSNDDEIIAEVNNEQRSDGPIIELYDSGSMHHILPFKKNFDTLSTIPPKSFTATNKQSFNAIGAATFTGGKCILHDPAKEVIRQIPKTSKGLYHIIHDESSGSVHAAIETPHGPYCTQRHSKAC
ncbi:uncharacterized protein BJ212DRAFT_1299873 [Suillus subaureus]|uniref:Uncharacterized protein n=1 Tax=Suillus subaureus TaxID=48587 RepID=A0A9P7JD15_9AGAM|nr:uncharacterized protein BJ212DRAFT_1299873 [Suillus subaureus]KAG1816025.1 hypothetical protein BJ212DRAFT_1299873 [Suillus subaureus]